MMFHFGGKLNIVSLWTGWVRLSFHLLNLVLENVHISFLARVGGLI